jgi:hypothetical protein
LQDLTLQRRGDPALVANQFALRLTTAGIGHLAKTFQQGERLAQVRSDKRSRPLLANKYSLFKQLLKCLTHRPLAIANISPSSRSGEWRHQGAVAPLQ